MTNLSNDVFETLTGRELLSTSGGAGKLDFNAIRAKAKDYCPQTVAAYGNVDPASVTRPKAQRMGEACLAEMGSFKASFARGPMQDAIDKAFPR